MTRKNNNEPSKIYSFFAGDTFKRPLPFNSIPLAIVVGGLIGAAIWSSDGIFRLRFKFSSLMSIIPVCFFGCVYAYLRTEIAAYTTQAMKILDSDNLKIGVTLAALVVAFFLFKFTRVGTEIMISEEIPELREFNCKMI